ncbi:heavy metal-associated domain-containing protein [Flavobacterium sp. ST-87]|uniref:Heavy metal-associated domain-containing protein n=1 Tax=Flavobacterium plantiphilum TaxID=3163297 RepID=A0ABW8XRE4_9FLAO
MKTDIIIKRFIVLMLLIGMTSSYAQISKAEITATGLTCSMCSNAINKQLKAMPEVEKVMIDLNSNTFVVNFKKNSLITPQDLKHNIEKTGFFVGSMILTMNAENVKPKDNSSFKNETGTYVFVNPVTKPEGDKLRLKILNSGFVTKKEYKKTAKMLLKYSVSGKEEGIYYVKTI